MKTVALRSVVLALNKVALAQLFLLSPCTVFQPVYLNFVVEVFV